VSCDDPVFSVGTDKATAARVGKVRLVELAPAALGCNAISKVVVPPLEDTSVTVTLFWPMDGKVSRAA